MMYSKHSPFVRTIIQVPEDWLKELKKISADNNESMSQSVRKALRHFYKLDHFK